MKGIIEFKDNKDIEHALNRATGYLRERKWHSHEVIVNSVMFYIEQLQSEIENLKKEK